MRFSRHLRTALLTLAMLSLGFLRASAQSSSPPSQDQQLLSQLSDAADELNHKLPNFTCDESVVSEEIQQGKVRRHVTFKTTIRVQRNTKGELEERVGDKSTYEVGFFSALTHRIPSTPVYMSGGFGQALDYFSAAKRLCWEYKISTGRVDFTSALSVPPQCKSPGTHGFALLDTGSNVTHIERTVAPEAAGNQATFAAVDFEPIEFDGHLYRLSHHVVGEISGGHGILRRFTADFSNCKLYTATITLKPAGDASPSQP